MNLIQQAIRRLEQLEGAGASMPWRTAARHGNEAGAAVPPPPAPAPEDNGAASAPTGAGVTIDPAVCRRNGLLVADDVRSELAQQFRRIKRPLLGNLRQTDAADGRSRAHVVVTSAVAGEGKTYCAINLALSLAMEVDTAVLLVDADVVRPTVAKRLGVDLGPSGLMDLLVDPALRLEDVIRHTNVPKLSLMGAGTFQEHSAEWLASAAMDQLLRRLSRAFPSHVVVFDAPPLLLTTESRVLAEKAGQVVVVVEAGRTDHHSIKQAHASLQDCPLVFSVLNKTDQVLGNYQYGYGYGPA